MCVGIRRYTHWGRAAIHVPPWVWLQVGVQGPLGSDLVPGAEPQCLHFKKLPQALLLPSDVGNTHPE